MLCFRHSNLIWVCCTISQHLWCCPGEGDVPQPLVAALSSPSAQTTLISAVTGAPLHPESLLPPLSTFLFFCGLFPAHPVEEGGATTVHSWDFLLLGQGQGGFSFYYPFIANSLCIQGASSVNPRAQQAGCTQITTTHQTAQMRNRQLSTGSEKSRVNITKKTEQMQQGK